MTHALNPRPVVELDYEALYADYEARLVDRLRGFGSAAECLALWVPDENPLVSLRNMIEAAAESGLPAVEIVVGVATQGELDRAELLEVASRHGAATLSLEGLAWRLRIDGLAPATEVAVQLSTATAHASRKAASPEHAETQSFDVSAYDKALQAIAASSTHGRSAPLTATPPQVLATASVGTTTLWLVVDPSDHTIVQACHNRDGDPQSVGAIEAVCRHIIGRPIQEAADHGTLRAEAVMRPANRPVPGIVLPGQIHPAFAHAQALLRRARHEYGRHTGYTDIHNGYDPGPREPWRSYSPRARKAKVEQALTGFLQARSLSTTTFQFVEVLYDVRVTLHLDEALAAEDRPALTMACERYLRDHLDPRLEVYLEERRDKNSLRRLAIVPSDTSSPKTKRAAP